MIEPPQILRTEPLHFAAVRRQCPPQEIGKIMGPNIQQVLAALKAQDRTPIGPWFTHHFRRPIDFFDLEICFPVDSPINPDGDVHPGVWPAMTVARTVFHGNYAGLPGAWGELEAWMNAERHTGQGEFWERYTVNPNDDPNPDHWRTELNWPLAPEV
jgi:effector-binding domain-containing protein